ncbi:serine hydrolase [Salininema proteolyticum]|uniref:Beta-lactamase class A n=1 Tax=Salininema proteolyticum TaxID=1607685 RepID=A0ABV8TUV1_9ACTN
MSYSQATVPSSPARRSPFVLFAGVLAVLAVLALGGSVDLREPPGDNAAGLELVKSLDLAGEYSVVLHEHATGERVVAYRADEAHPSQSTVKILIAVVALEQGTDPDTVAEMLTASDDEIASRLWSEFGGPDIVSTMAVRMGLKHTSGPADWGRWGDTRVSAADMVRVYAFLHGSLDEDLRKVVMDALVGMAPTGADGFDQTFGLPRAGGPGPWAVKQGWACCAPDRNLVTTGTLTGDRRYTAAVFGSWDSDEVGWEEAAEEISAVSEALVERVPAVE